MRPKYFLIITILSFFITESCKKFLSEDPQTQYTTDNFYTDEASLDAGLVGLYSEMISLYDVNTNTPLFMTELGTDELMFKGTSGIRYNFDRYTFSASEGGIYQFWARDYAIAMQATILIAAANNVSTISDSVRNSIIGEAKFVRAFIYFRLVRAFGAIPIMDTAITGSIDYGKPREPIKDVYDFILSDLNFAVGQGVLTTSKTGNAHPSHWAAEALLGKVYLTIASYKESAKVDGYDDIDSSTTTLYSLAWNVLKNVIDSSGAELLPVYGDVFNIDNKNTNLESIWEIQFSSVSPYGSQWSKELGMVASGTIDGNPAYYTNAMAGVANEVYVPKFYEYYKSGPKATDYDQRRVWNLADSIINVVNSVPTSLTYLWGSAYSPDYYNQTILGRCGVTKYRWGSSWTETSSYLYSNEPTNVIVLRYADVLLMFAEADYKMNGTISQEGLDAINSVRERARGLDASGNAISESATPGFNNYTASEINVDTILIERGRELCFEFQRWFDLARTGKFETFLAKTRPTDDANITNTATEFDASKNYLFPIPQTEIDLSTNKSNFQQNPGY
ncbi:MAG: RagB/SusD family nutrient uptake outer membrane protein [Chitinophagaceae bacterium]